MFGITMAILDFPAEARLHGIEERLGTIERDLAVIKARLDSMPTAWALVGLVLPLYGVLIFGLAGVFYVLLSRLPVR